MAQPMFSFHLIHPWGTSCQSRDQHVAHWLARSISSTRVSLLTFWHFPIAKQMDPSEEAIGVESDEEWLIWRPSWSSPIPIYFIKIIIIIIIYDAIILCTYIPDNFINNIAICKYVFYSDILMMKAICCDYNKSLEMLTIGISSAAISYITN